MKNWLFYACLLLWLCNGLDAQTIKGIVVDHDNKEPLIGANVFLKSDFSKGCQTDLDGNFSLTVSSLSDTLLITYIGYSDLWLPIKEDMTDAPVKIKLKAAATTISTVTVSAKKLVSREFAVESINKLDIYLNPSAKADALLAVQSLPSVTNSDEAANISLRGSPPSETGIFLNNVPLNDVVRFDQANGIGQFSIFNTNLIETVNVFPSNPPLEFGHATSGVVALYTDDELPERLTGVSLNLVGLGVYRSQQLGKQTAMVAYGNLNTHHGLVGLNRSSLENLNSLQTIDGGIYAIHRFGPSTVLKVFNFSLFEKYQYKSRFPGYSGLYRQKKDRNLSIVNFSHRYKKFQWQVNQGFNFSQASYSIGVLDVSSKTADYHASATASYLGNSTTLKAGVSYDMYKVQLGGVFPLYEYAFGEDHPSGTFDTLQRVNSPEVFVYGKKNLNDYWTVGAGFRWHPGLGSLPAYESVQANIAYQPKKGHQFILSVGEYEKFRLPRSGEDAVIRQHSRQLSIDYRWQKSRWGGNLAFYGKQNKQGTIDNPIYGAEFFISYEGTNLSGSFSVASIQSTFQTEELEYPTAYDMDYYIRAMLKYRFNGGLEISGVYRLREGRYYQPVIGAQARPFLNVYEPIYASLEEGERLPAYQLLDMSVSRLFATSFGTLITYVNVNNVFDQRNIRYFTYNEDYTQPVEEYFNRRVVFFGVVLQF